MALMVSDLSGRIQAAPLCDNQYDCFRVEAGREGAAAAAGESGGG